MPNDTNGLAAAADLVESVREDLRAHDERDQDAFKGLREEMVGARGDLTAVAMQVGWMRGELVAHGETLKEIRTALSRRARTEETLLVDTERFKKRRNLTILKAVLGVLASGAAIMIGALLHRYLG